ncbi:MAG TPA: V-type ATP synthase subunit D [Streptosporangiaceae bacterium]|nr:V-type ATP synthase subunit D [Streptosporangiaceae bacterium]
MISGAPPGRTGRLWLRHRLAVAERAADLLDRKLRILLAEQDRLRRLARRRREEWESRCAEADEWLMRAALLGGRRALRLAADGEAAAVTVDYEATMGVRHPVRAEVAAPPPPGTALDGAVVNRAREACRAALAAAAAYAAAATAARLVEEEVRVTRQRVRAVKTRWMPRLQSALTEIELMLEEQEREDGARLRRLPGRHRG